MLFIDEKKVRRNFAQILRILSKKKKEKKKTENAGFELFNLVVSRITPNFPPDSFNIL